MGRGSFTIGSIAGVRIGLHPSWLVIAFLITYSLAVGDLPDRFRGWEPILYWVVAAGVALLFFASVLAHELSHALVARRYGIEVKDITLFIFGGAASLEGDARTPGQEALIAFAGPLSSLVIGAVLIGIGLVWPQEQVLALIGWLAVINLSLGVFNLLPGFPMDGGRILRALIWKVRGDPEVATRNAAAVGRLVGYLLIGVGAVIAFQGILLGGIWLALIGWFIATAAEATVQQTTLQRSLRGVAVRDVRHMQPAARGALVEDRAVADHIGRESSGAPDDRARILRFGRVGASRERL